MTNRLRILLPVMCLLAIAATLAAEQSPPRPNIVIILADDLGWGDLGCYGNKLIPTPRIDGIAAGGARLTAFYGAPLCGPARAMLLTGRQPHRVGVPSNGGQLRDSSVTLAETLRASGYDTGCFGKWHLGKNRGSRPLDQGFTEAWVPELSSAQVETMGDANRRSGAFDAAIQFIEKPRDKPFFCYIPTSLPHAPFQVDPAFNGRSSHGIYGDMVACLDHHVGRVLDALKAKGIEDRTLVIFVSDNGPPSLEMLRKYQEAGDPVRTTDKIGSAGPWQGTKGSASEGGMRVCAIARWPGRIPAGLVSGSVAGLIDLHPTCAALAGAPLDASTVDGRDIWPLLTAPDAPSPHDAYGLFHQGVLIAVRSGRWRFEMKDGRLFDLETDSAQRSDLAQRERATSLSLRAAGEKLASPDRGSK